MASETETLSTKDSSSAIRGNVLAFGLVSLFQDMAGEMIYPLLPWFMFSVLFAPAWAIGLVEGEAESLSSLLKIISGWLSDRSGQRKAWASAGYGLSGLVKPLFALTMTWPQVLAVRALDRVGKGVRGLPRDSLMAQDVPANKRGQAFGFHRSMDTLGAVLGPILATVLIGVYQSDLRPVFAWAVVPGVISLVLSLVLVREKPAPTKVAAPPKLTLKPFDTRFKRLLVVLLVFTLANSSDAFLLLRARDLGIPLLLIPSVWLTFNVVQAVSAGPAGWLSDRLNRKTLLLAGFLVYTLAYIGFALVHQSWQIWPLFALYGLYYGMTDGVGRAFTADLAPAELRGTAFGLYYLLTGIMLLPASIIAGVLWDAIAPWAPFAFGAAWSLVATVLLVILV